MKNLTLVGVITLGLALGGCTSEVDHEDYLPQEEVEAKEVDDVVEYTSELDDLLTEYAENNNGKYSEYLKVITLTKTIANREAYIELSDEIHAGYREIMEEIANLVGTVDGYEVRIKYVGEDTGTSVGTLTPADLGKLSIWLNDECNPFDCPESESASSEDNFIPKANPLANAGLTLVNFNKYKDGMTMEEVEQLFGIDKELYVSTKTGGSTAQKFIWEDGNKTVMVDFIDFKSTGIAQTGLK